MRFASFYHMSVPQPGKPSRPIEACGSDSVLPLDARQSLENSAIKAREMCKKRKYVGFTIQQGSSYTRCHEVRAYEAVPVAKD